jgi:serine/threonine protein kinase
MEGSAAYLAPEIANMSVGYATTASDVFSLGFVNGVYCCHNPRPGPHVYCTTSHTSTAQTKQW